MIVVQLLLLLILLICIRTVHERILRLSLFFIIVFFSLQLVLWLFTRQGKEGEAFITWLLFNMNLVFFFLGCMAIKGNDSVSRETEGKDPLQFSNKTIKILLLLNIIVVIVQIQYFKKQNLLLLALVGQSARELYFGMRSESLFGSYSEYLLYFFFIKNYLYLCSFQFAIVIFSRRMGLLKILLLALSIASIVISALIGQGRADMLVLVYFIVGYVVFALSERMIRAKDVVIAFMFIAIAIIAIMYITVLRMNINLNESSIDITGIIKPFIDYFTFPLTAFCYRYNEFAAAVGLMGGQATFAGIQELLITPAMAFNGSLANYLTNSQIGALTTPFVEIDGKSWNALYTGMLNYYLDFGMAGFAIFPFLYGVVFRLLARWAASAKKKGIALFIFVYVLQAVLNNQIVSSPQQMGFWSVLAIVLIISFLRSNRGMIKYVLIRRDVS